MLPEWDLKSLTWRNSFLLFLDKFFEGVGTLGSEFHPKLRSAEVC